MMAHIVYICTYQYKSWLIGSCPGIVVWLSVSVLLVALVFFTSKIGTAPVYYPLFQFSGFVMCIVWIHAICNEAVNILAALGVFWNVSNTIMGILILAPANSIGDYVADTALARNGKVVTAFGAVYSGPLLNLLMGVGISCTIANIVNH